MSIRVIRKNKSSIPAKKRATKKRIYNGPTKKWCRPKLIYSIEFDTILTSSKWYQKPLTCIYDWLQRGFVVIEDEKLGGGFEFRDFPDIPVKELAEKNRKKLNIED